MNISNLYDNVYLEIEDAATFSLSGDSLYKLASVSSVDAAAMEPSDIISSDQTATIDIIANKYAREALFPKSTEIGRVLTPIGRHSKSFIFISNSTTAPDVGHAYIGTERIVATFYQAASAPLHLMTDSEVQLLATMYTTLSVQGYYSDTFRLQVGIIHWRSVHTPIRITKSLSMLRQHNFHEILGMQYGVPLMDAPLSLYLRPCTYTLDRKDGTSRTLLNGVIREIKDSGDKIQVVISNNLEAELAKTWPEVKCRYPFTKKGISDFYTEVSSADYSLPNVHMDPHRRFEPCFICSSRNGFYMGDKTTPYSNRSRWGGSPFYWYGRESVGSHTWKWLVSSECAKKNLENNHSYGITVQPLFVSGCAYSDKYNNQPYFDEEIGGFEGTRAYEYLDQHPAGLLEYNVVALTGCAGEYSLPSWTGIRDAAFTGASADDYILVRPRVMEDMIDEYLTTIPDLTHPVTKPFSSEPYIVGSSDNAYAWGIDNRYFGAYRFGEDFGSEWHDGYGSQVNFHEISWWWRRETIRNRNDGVSYVEADFEPNWPSVIRPDGIIRMPKTLAGEDFFGSQLLVNGKGNDHDIGVSDRLMSADGFTYFYILLLLDLASEEKIYSIHNDGSGFVQYQAASLGELYTGLSGAMYYNSTERFIPYEFWHDKTLNETFFENANHQLAVVFVPASDGRVRPLWLGMDLLDPFANSYVIDETNIRDPDHTIQHAEKLPIRSVTITDTPKRLSMPMYQAFYGSPISPNIKGFGNNGVTADDDDRAIVVGESTDRPIWSNVSYWDGQKVPTDINILSDYAEDLSLEGEDIEISCKGWMQRDSSEWALGGNIKGGHLSIAQRCWERAVENYGLPYPTVVLNVDERFEGFVGDLVDIYLPNMPNPHGSLGVYGMRGQVWERGDNIHDGTAEIQILLVGWYVYQDPRGD